MGLTGLQRGKNGTDSINVYLPTTGTPVNGVAAQATLTIAEPVTAEDTVVIGSTTYTFKADGTADTAGQIDMGASEAATKLNIVTAIKGTDGWNSANTEVGCATAFSGDDLVFTALVKGVAGDLLASTEGLTHASNVWDATTFGTTTAGVDSTVGVAGQQYIDSTYLYISVDDSLISTANWRRVSLGSAY